MFDVLSGRYRAAAPLREAGRVELCTPPGAARAAVSHQPNLRLSAPMCGYLRLIVGKNKMRAPQSERT